MPPPKALSKFGHGLGKVLVQVFVDSVYFTNLVSLHPVDDDVWAPPRIIRVLLNGFQLARFVYSSRLPPFGGARTAPLLNPFMLTNSPHVPGCMDAAKEEIEVPVSGGGGGVEGGRRCGSGTDPGGSGAGVFTAV